MPIKPLPRPPGGAAGSVLMADDSGGTTEWNPMVEWGNADVAGDSHISEFGPSVADYGVAQKIAGALKPGILRNCALGGAIQAFQDQGNGSLGDGGWAHIGNEFNRQEQSSQKYNTTVTQTQASGVSSTTVTSLTNGAAPLAGEFLVLGAGTQTEIVQVAQNWNGASPLTFENPTTQAHTTGDPIYHACRNEGYLAKSTLVLLCAEGINDLGIGGPGAPPSPLSNSWIRGVFGTNRGASVGFGPFMHSLRFSLANLRCSVIYASDHPSVVYGANWTNNPQTSTASYPAGITPFNGFNNGSWRNTTVAGSTLSFSTGPDFPGGTVCIFCFVGSSGQGAIWDYSVSGATTVAMTTHSANTLYDTRNQTLVAMNKATNTGSVPGTCIRITGLAAGVNTVTLKATTLATYGAFLGWGVEAPNPPVIFPVASSRVPGEVVGTQIIAGPGANYNRRALGTITGGTVTAGHGAAAGEVTFVGGTLGLATAGTPSQTLAQEGDTITLDKGSANEETRRIVGFTGSPATACQVDANFTGAHTNGAIQIGLQDADYVGGGYFNQADTVGAASVPGAAACINAVAAEFDSNVVPVAWDPFINGGPGTTVNPLMFYADGVHYNDQGSGAISAGMGAAILVSSQSLKNIASVSVPNKRTFTSIYGDTGATPAANTPTVQIFQNSWTNVYSSTFANATTYPRAGYYKDFRTRQVEVSGAVTGGTGNGSTIFTLPAGMRPSSSLAFPARAIAEDGTEGSAVVVIDSSGNVICQSGYPGATGALVFSCFYPTEQ